MHKQTFLTKGFKIPHVKLYRVELMLNDNADVSAREAEMKRMKGHH